MATFQERSELVLQFGTVPNPRAIEFGALPALQRAGSPAADQKTGALALFFGAPVWSDKQWVGSLYPPKTKQSDFLGVYSRVLTGVELNSTFYSVPSPEATARWRDQVPPGFRFSPKFHQGISHSAIVPPGDVLGFVESMRALGDSLGLSFLQLPDRVSPAQYGQVERILRLVPRDFATAVEFRHPGWFARGQLGPAALRLLADTGRYAVVTDVPGRRDVLHGTLVGDRVLVRFSGCDGDPSDVGRLEQWTARLLEWRAAGVREAYFYLHSPDPSHIPELISRFVDAAGRRGLELPDWRKSSAPPEPAQLAMF